MITVVSGTNRPGSNTRKIAVVIQETLEDAGEEVTLLDLALLPVEIFDQSSYASTPGSFATFQDQILNTDGLLTVVPEYNGSFPGALKYFIDMLSVPESLYEKPAAFVGISSGRWGWLRAVEHLEKVLQYRHAHLFGRRCFIPGVSHILDENGRLTDPDVAERLKKSALDFTRFCRNLGTDQE